ncbi:nitrous oxide reductase accessory protein NosL/NosD [Natronorubrum sp. JWXQ-INN-674]|uniref:Nitrous oxide reductase accessory protein NosL/NosD n=1 Tax=Natronorubrum halalkaliphilum TaxID=2691917 RepID=A0A6B0VSP3_9EURY|nr:nitrous oxide reductase accessory protein NosL/NosD [Natronorubrum halalkaliphilum]
MLAVVVLASVGLFVVDPGSTTPDPVVFDDTVPVGLTLEAERGLDDDVELPRTQVFYSQYRYVVGYYGVETFVETQRQPEHEQRFGYPMTVYVSDYSDTGVELTEEGHPTADRQPGWTDAESTWFVVDSDAVTPHGKTVVPFSDREDAAAFTDEHGGTVHDWASILETRFDGDDATVARDRVDDRHQQADERIETAEPLADRPTSIVVGDDTETIQEAIEEAPANTTIEIPEGTYEETIEIDRPVTLAGDGDVTLRGDGNGTVATVIADRVAITGLEIDGVGNVTTEGRELPVDFDDDAWDAAPTQFYAGTDAGIATYAADELLVQDVRIDTPASGIITYAGADIVIRDVTVSGPEDPSDGLAGVLSFQSASVIEASTYQGGSNGIYLYRSPTTVIRENTLEGNRLGIHLMHTDDALLADNVLRGQQNTGIYIMTGPQRNAVVGNTVRETATGLSPGGSDTYVAENSLVENELGLRVDTTASIYENNVVAGNDVGAAVSTILPTNRVVGNDFVANGEHATASAGPLRIWSHGGDGNYWQGGAGVADGDRADRSYTPTDAIDSRLHRTDGTQTLARAPALQALAGLEGSVPGMRTGSIVDQAPTCEPNNPDLLERTGWADHAWPCYETTRTITHD